MADQAAASASAQEALTSISNVRDRLNDLMHDTLPRLAAEIREITDSVSATELHIQECLDHTRAADETGYFEESQTVHRLGDFVRDKNVAMQQVLTAMGDSIRSLQVAVAEDVNVSAGVFEALESLAGKLAG